MTRNFFTNEEGFSLTEMAITLSMVGIFLLIAIPNLNLGRDRDRLRNAARQFESDLRYAQALSIGQNVNQANSQQVVPAGVVIAQDTGAYTVFTDRDGSGTYELTPNDEKEYRVDLHEKVAITAMEGAGCVAATNTCTVLFDQLTGAPQSDYVITFTLRGAVSTQKVVRLSAGGGISVE